MFSVDIRCIGFKDFGAHVVRFVGSDLANLKC